MNNIKKPNDFHSLKTKVTAAGPVPKETKCNRCYRYGCATESDYNLCQRCQQVLLIEYNNLCVSCGEGNAVNNLCSECRNKRIKEYDSKYQSCRR